jgi:hypothetical protein
MITPEKVAELKANAPAAPYFVFRSKVEAPSIIGGKDKFELVVANCGGLSTLEFMAAVHDMADLIAEQANIIAAQDDKLFLAIAEMNQAKVNAEYYQLDCNQRGREIERQTEEIRQLKADSRGAEGARNVSTQLKRFGKEVFHLFWNDGSPSDVDGASIQELAVKHKLLVRIPSDNELYVPAEITR